MSVPTSETDGSSSGGSWVALTLFYCVASARGSESEPSAVAERAVVLFGEGVLTTARPSGASVRTRSLDDGLHALDVVGTLASVRRQLTAPHFDFRIGRADAAQQRIRRFDLGLIERPSIASGHPAAGLTSTLGGSRITPLLHFVRPEKARSIGDAADGLRKAANRFRTLVGLDLAGAGCRLFGEVLILDRRGPSFSIWWTPAGPDWTPNALMLSCDFRDVSAGAITINVRAFGTDDCLVEDMLVSGTPAALSMRLIRFNQMLGAVELRAWIDGHLAWRSKEHALLEMASRINLPAGSIRILDRLSELVERNVPANAQRSTAERVKVVEQYARGPQVVVGAQSDPWRSSKQNSAAELFELLPPQHEHTYFRRGAEGRANAFMRLARLVDEADRAWLIDPYFDESGAEALLPRLGGTGCALTIVTSLEDDSEVRRLARMMHALAKRGLIRSECRLVHVTTSGGEQLFHDRFLITAKSGRVPQGLMLSNSLSGMARNYSLVVQPLGTGTTARVLAEADAMLSGRASQGGQVKHLWPTRAATKRVRRQRRAEPWPSPSDIELLKRLVSRRGLTSGNLPAEAQRLGWLRRTDGATKWVMPDGQTECSLLDRLLARRGRRGDDLCSQVAEIVYAIGEATARGWRISSADVARRLGQGERDALLEGLCKKSRRRVSSLHAGSSLARLCALLQATTVREGASPDVALVEAGMRLLLDRRIASDALKDWGRQFTYEVLLRLDPSSGIRTACQLTDGYLVVALLRPIGREVIDESIAHALLACDCPALQGVGCQWIAEGEGEPSHRLRPPLDVDAVIDRLRAAGASDRVVVLACAAWGPQASGLASAKLADHLVAVLHESDWVHVRAAFEDSDSLFVARMLGALESAARYDFLSNMLQDYAGRVRSEHAMYWSARAVDEDVMAAMGRAACFVAGREGRSGAELVWELVNGDSFVRRTDKVSPLRRARDVAAPLSSLALTRIWERYTLPSGDGAAVARWRLAAEPLATDGALMEPIRDWLSALVALED